MKSIMLSVCLVLIGIGCEARQSGSEPSGATTNIVLEEDLYFYAIKTLGVNTPGVGTITKMACFPNVRVEVVANLGDLSEHDNASAYRSKLSISTNRAKIHNSRVKKKLETHGDTRCKNTEDWDKIGEELGLYADRSEAVSHFAFGVREGFSLFFEATSEPNLERVMGRVCEILKGNGVHRNIPLVITTKQRADEHDITKYCQ